MFAGCGHFHQSKMANSALMRYAAASSAPPFKKSNFCHTCATGNARASFYFDKSDTIPADQGKVALNLWKGDGGGKDGVENEFALQS